jgi:hypothetical protein
MKKAFLIMAAALTVAAISCKKPENGQEEQTPGAQVTVAAENLVAYFPLESAEKAVTVGEGITFDSKKGAGDFGDGQIGKAYTNTKKMNIEEAYLKFKLAKGNAFSKLESMTFSAWVLVPTPLPDPSDNTKKLTAKGAIFSFNGTGVEPVWPSFVYLLDNEGINEETNEPWMQFNGRIDFLSVEDKPAMWPNVSDKAYAGKDKWFHIARTYDATTGAWANFANGLKINDGLFTPKNGGKDPAGAIKAAFADDCNALYLGGWASRIEGKASDTWLNYFCGSIDEVRFYNKALSEAEILDLYKQELKVALGK